MSFDVTTVPLPRHHLSRRAVIIAYTPPRASSRRRNRRRRRRRSHRRRRRRVKTRARQSIKSINRRAPSPFPRKLVSETVTTPMMMMIQNVIFVCTCLYVYTV